MIVVVEPLADRVSTWKVLAGDVVLGVIRQAKERGDVWVARTLGSATTAAAIRRFPPNERHAAIQWLAERERVPV
jgi:hypothetical protein